MRQAISPYLEILATILASITWSVMFGFHMTSQRCTGSVLNPTLSTFVPSILGAQKILVNSIYSLIWNEQLAVLISTSSTFQLQSLCTLGVFVMLQQGRLVAVNFATIVTRIARSVMLGLDMSAQYGMSFASKTTGLTAILSILRPSKKLGNLICL